MKRAVLIAFNIAFLCAAIGCIAGPPFTVDDPATTEYRHFNILTTYQSSQNPNGEMQATPNFLLNYGLTDKVELGLGFGASSVRGAGLARQAGLADTTFAVRWRFLDETKKRPQFLLGYQAKFPTADANRGLGTGQMDHILWLAAAKSFKRYYVFGNVGYNKLGNHVVGKDNLYYGVGLTYQVNEKWIVGGQFYGNAPSAAASRSELAWGLGVTYAFAPDKAFLLSLGRSERGYSDLNVYTGFCFNFK